MPVNAPSEYFAAEAKFHSAKTKEEKIAALEEMIRLLPRHHGSETAIAQLKSRLAKLKKESEKSSKGSRGISITKEGEAQVCVVGYTNSGKSSLLRKLTSAKPAVADHPYTTTKPEVGMLNYKGVMIQLVEIPATFEPRFISIARTSDLILILARHENEERDLKKFLAENFIRSKHIFANPFAEPPDMIKEKIWHNLGLIVVFTKKGKVKTPMALSSGSTVRDFALRVHKDFVRNFRFARIYRGGRTIQAGLDYRLQDDDIVEIHAQ